MGVAVAQQAYIRSDLASGKLVAPFDFVLNRPKGYFLVCPKDRAEMTKIMTFRNWLLERIATLGDRDAAARVSSTETELAAASTA
jgi:LysR family glycine cleavage system transcriptional activator